LGWTIFNLVPFSFKQLPFPISSRPCLNTWIRTPWREQDDTQWHHFAYVVLYILEFTHTSHHSQTYVSRTEYRFRDHTSERIIKRSGNRRVHVRTIWKFSFTRFPDIKTWDYITYCGKKKDCKWEESVIFTLHITTWSKFISCKM
jgi:hypothetical protein